MGKKQSFRSKAAHFVSDLTTVLLNPISDNNNNNNNPISLPPSEEEDEEAGESNGSHDHEVINSIDGPDTSSFTAFLYSLLSSSDSGVEKNDDEVAGDDSAVKTSLFSRGKHSLGRAIQQAALMGAFRVRDTNRNNNYTDTKFNEGIQMKCLVRDPVPVVDHYQPQISEPSMLVSDGMRDAVYASLPGLVHGRKWMLLYSTWKHGISLSTLYRRSMLWPGSSLLVVGDRKGAVFGGLVEAPLRPSNKRKYQGTNNSFVFTNTSGCPVIYHPTGENRYFTLCTTDFLAIGGGSHFALYLDDCMGPVRFQKLTGILALHILKNLK
ncbi:uncharacterized protein LOC109813513 isoform X2 [Cajanus cajan]|uniref:uncharacterized protein LOC109813513 isoform X2 n=1 Tax=Cajanus cajan TaxID=3821 RepID=UPI00098DBA86|nr:uncharacterized protein LOC109813513 isoform X2 [Cajanus cajan]